MTDLAFWILAIYGLIMIVASIYGASQHGKSKGEHNAGFEAAWVLVGVLWLLIAFGVI